MSEMPDGITQEELDRYAKLDKAIKKFQIEHKSLNARIKAAFKKVGTFQFGSVIVKRTESTSKKFDSEAFALAYPASKRENRKYYSVTVDAAKIPAELALEYTEFGTIEKLSVDVVS